MKGRIEIRSETNKDIPVIAEVTAAAFQFLEVSNQTEHYIIEALRAARALSLSLVAEFQGRVIGHIAFSPLRTSDGTPDWYGLGPVSVLPKYQRQGVGKALVQEGLSRLKDLQARGCCLVGHPEYYKKFGFDTLPGLVHEGVPPEVFLALSFDGKIPQGTALFHEGFKAEAPLSMLDKLTSLQPSDRSVELYDEWAPVYEEDLVGGYGYESPWIAAEYFADFCPEARTRIMDFGCGTGLSGQALAARGYARIDGLDVSEQMLREARQKGVYQNLVRADLTGRTGLADASYEAAICVNAFGNGHLRPEHLGEMIRMVQEGGLLVFFINARPYEDDEYPACFQRLQAAGIWRIEKTACINYMRELDRPGWVVVARRQAAAL